MIMSLRISKIILLILYFQVLGCATTLQYTAPRDKDNNLSYKMRPVDIGVCSNCFRYSEGSEESDLFYKEVKVHFGSPERCTNWFLGIIPTGWGKCYPSYPYQAKEYWLSLSIENISAKPIGFDVTKIKLVKAGEKIDYVLDMERKSHIIMPNDRARLMMTIGDWSKVGTEFYIDLTEALSTEEKIIIRIERFTSIKYGLMPTD
jgi:hypothetical protein